MPAFKSLSERHGKNPIVVVSREYANIFDGVSYVEAWIVPMRWPDGVEAARGLAELHLPWVETLQFWNDEKSRFRSEACRQARVLQCHGKNWRIDADKWPDYGTAMWSIAGFSRDDMLAFPLVFDLRDEEREESLRRLYHHHSKPNLLVNFKGISSPFPWTPEFQRTLSRYRDRFNIVDVGMIHAERIYDLLGLYDRAAGLITIDTATLHLAPASKVAYIAFTRRDWSGSVPRGTCVLNIGYDQGTKRMADFERVLQSWAQKAQPVHA